MWGGGGGGGGGWGTMAGKKQLNFSVKKKPQTTDYVFHIRFIIASL